MRARLLGSVLATVFSAALAVGTLSAASPIDREAPPDSGWTSVGADPADSGWTSAKAGPADSGWTSVQASGPGDSGWTIVKAAGPADSGWTSTPADADA